MEEEEEVSGGRKGIGEGGGWERGGREKEGGREVEERGKEGGGGREETMEGGETLQRLFSNSCLFLSSS